MHLHPSGWRDTSCEYNRIAGKDLSGQSRMPILNYYVREYHARQLSVNQEAHFAEWPVAECRVAGQIIQIRIGYIHVLQKRQWTHVE